MILVFTLPSPLMVLLKWVLMLGRKFLLLSLPTRLIPTFPRLCPVFLCVVVIAGCGFLGTEAELCPLRLLTTLRSRVELSMAWEIGLTRLSEEVTVTVLKWEMLLHAGPMFMALARVLGR